MKTFEEEMKKIQLWEGYDWNTPSKAVVASDGKGCGAVLWTVGPHVAYVLNEVGLNELGDLGLDNCPKGIWIWEGTSKVYHSPDGEDDWMELLGEFRKPTFEEGELILENKCPMVRY